MIDQFGDLKMFYGSTQLLVKKYSASCQANVKDHDNNGSFRFSSHFHAADIDTVQHNALAFNSFVWSAEQQEAAYFLCNKLKPPIFGFCASLLA
jgi:hypothetical protein